MKILIINQHSQNHGDEAAGKALLRTLRRHGFEELAVSYNMPCTDRAALLSCPGVTQVVPRFYLRGTARLLRGCLKHWRNPVFRRLPLLLPRLLGDYRAIAASDVVINGPGGVNLGLYQDVIYLWRLLACRSLNKKLFIYSPSIGPFPPNSYFTEHAADVLAHASFLSLRDPQSGRYARELGFTALDSIDTAYLESPEVPLPDRLAAELREPYVVLVPHQLYRWHPKYQDLPPEQLDRFYRELIAGFHRRGCRIVLLPQIFCHEAIADERYFRELATDFPGVTVVPQEYDSDVQQQIIRNAQFVVGARYHTIVFAINQGTPFFSIAYEHKMTNMLERLRLTGCSVGIREALAAPDACLRQIEDAYERRGEQLPAVAAAREEAKRIAAGTFEQLLTALREPAGPC